VLMEPQSLLEEKPRSQTSSPEDEPQMELQPEDDMFLTNIQKTYTSIDAEAQSQNLADRKRRLSEMSFRLNKNTLNELESTPAYLRQGVDIGSEGQLPSQEKHISQFTVSEDTL